MRPCILRYRVGGVFRRQFGNSLILKIDSKNVNIKPNWEFFRKTAKNGITIRPETLKDTNDFQLATNEYKKIMEQLENNGSIKCKTCGTTSLQSNNSSDDKYFELPKVSLKFPKKNNTVDVNNLDESILKEMGISIEDGPVTSEFQVKVEQKKHEIIEKYTHLIECKRCQNLKQHGIYDIHGCDVDSVMNNIPDNATVVHVVSLFDFPLSCNSEIMKNRDPKSIYYAVTKADLFYRKEVQIERTGLEYVRDVLKEYMNADPAKVFLVSSIKAWDINPFINKIPAGDVYFVGRANSGKSTLIKSIIASEYKIKLDDKVVKKIENKKKSYLENVGIASPGTYYIPGFTKEVQKFQYKGKYNLFDTPGFFPQNGGIYSHMLGGVIRKKLRYSQFTPEQRNRYTKIKVKGPKIFSGKSMYSYGGFFYLVPPKNVVMKTCLSFNRSESNFEARYADFKRAAEINKTRPVQIGKRYGVKPEAFDKLVRYVIPPFYGNIDIVIQDLGFLSIQPTSSVDNVEGLFQIYVPEGTRVIIRESIFKYAYKTHDTVDETGNRLRKDNISKRGATVLKSIYDEDKLHFSELIKVDMDIPSEKAFESVCPVADMKISKEKAHNLTQEKYPNQYWRKLQL